MTMTVTVAVAASTCGNCQAWLALQTAQLAWMKWQLVPAGTCTAPTMQGTAQAQHKWHGDITNAAAMLAGGSSGKG